MEISGFLHNCILWGPNWVGNPINNNNGGGWSSFSHIRKLEKERGWSFSKKEKKKEKRKKREIERDGDVRNKFNYCLKPQSDDLPQKGGLRIAFVI